MVSIPADPEVKNFSFTVVNEEVYYRENSVMNRMELPAMTAERVKGMVKIRDVTNELIQCQMEEGSDEQITKLQGKLNEEYDTFTAKYGLISSNANKRAFSQDSSYCLLTSLEFLDDKGELKRKADIFSKRTIRRAETVTSVDTASEALAVSIGERAGVDLSYMAQLSRKIFVRWLPFFTDWVLKDYPCQFFGKLLFCFSGKLCHIGKVNACPLTDRNRKCFTGSICRSYRFCPADCPFGKNIRFPFQFSLIIQKFQRSQKTIAAVLAKCPLIGITAKQTIFCCKGIVFFIEFSLQLCDLFIASLFRQ